MMQLKNQILSFGVLLLGLSSGVYAVEVKPLDAAARWQVVGVISGGANHGKEFGIAVLKSTSTKHTYTVSVGESLPTDGELILQSIHDKKVTITDGAKSYALEFAEADLKDSDSPAEQTARFLDSYYRGFENASPETTTYSNDATPGVAMEYRSFPQGGGRYGTLQDNPYRSRFELYRPEEQGRRDAYLDNAAPGAADDQEAEHLDAIEQGAMQGDAEVWNDATIVEYDADGNPLGEDSQADTTYLNQ